MSRFKTFFDLLGIRPGAGVDAARLRAFEDSAHGTSVRLEPGPVHLNMPMWLDRRRDPAVAAEIVERARQLLSWKR